MDAGALFSGPPASLEAVLAARDARAERRAELLKEGGVVISVSVVMPGAVKDCALSREVARLADEALHHALAVMRLPATRRYVCAAATGPESLWRVEGDPVDVKLAAVAIEDSHALGRLFDLDVESEDGAVTRSMLGLAPRRCLVCDDPARACGRSRRHTPEELRAAMKRLYRLWEQAR